MMVFEILDQQFPNWRYDDGITNRNKYRKGEEDLRIR